MTLEYFMNDVIYEEELIDLWHEKQEIVYYDPDNAATALTRWLDSMPHDRLIQEVNTLVEHQWVTGIEEKDIPNLSREEIFTHCHAGHHGIITYRNSLLGYDNDESEPPVFSQTK